LVLLFDDDCVALNVKAGNSRDVILLLSSILEKKGAISANYGEAADRREKSYPTGLPTEPFCIAFPHAGSEEVHQSALAVAILAEPVIFRSMQDPNINLPVLIVFLLATNGPDEQVKMLRRLTTFWNKPQNLTELRNYGIIADLVTWLRKELRLNN
jgi:galactitol PTS system EIIA component